MRPLFLSYNTNNPPKATPTNATPTPTAPALATATSSLPARAAFDVCEPDALVDVDVPLPVPEEELPDVPGLDCDSPEDIEDAVLDKAEVTIVVNDVPDSDRDESEDTDGTDTDGSDAVGTVVNERDTGGSVSDTVGMVKLAACDAA